MSDSSLVISHGDEPEMRNRARLAGCYPRPALTGVCHRLLAQARERVFVVCSGSHVPCTPMELQVFRRSLPAVLDRGVRPSLLDHFESLDVRNRREWLEELQELGVDVRISPSPPDGMLIIDGLVAVSCSNPAPNGQGCAPIRSGSVIASLQRLAHIAWRTSWNLELVSLLERRDSEVSLAVLRLLSAGYKDDVAARLLGMSVRTYRRHVAELIEMLQAHSRFEAGARAASLGLV